MPQGPACRFSGISEGGKADLNRLIYSPAAAGSVGAKESNGQRSNIRLSFVLHSDFPSFRIQFRPGHLLDPDQILPRRGCPNELINLHLQRGAVPVLGILNQKNHQERDDAADGIHDKLPCIGKAEQWPTYQPDDDEAARQPERPRSAGSARGLRGKSGEPVFVGASCQIAGPNCGSTVALDVSSTWRREFYRRRARCSGSRVRDVPLHPDSSVFHTLPGFLTGVHAPAACLGADPAMFVHPGVLLAFFTTEPASGGAGFQHSEDHLLV